MGGVWSTYLKLCQQLVQSGVYLEMAAHREDTNSQVVIVVCVYVFVSVGMWMCMCMSMHVEGDAHPSQEFLFGPSLDLTYVAATSPLCLQIEENVHENFQF